MYFFIANNKAAGGGGKIQKIITNLYLEYVVLCIYVFTCRKVVFHEYCWLGTH